jgi:NADH-quinone oxidoreductase subunit G
MRRGPRGYHAPAMPSITINGRVCDFMPGQMILQVANAHGVAIPQYCYHDGLSIVASCRICLAEVWAPNPRNNNALEPFMGGKLMPACQTAASDGMVVHTDSPKAVQNQKAVMEYLLINHPLDCPVCDQAGECFLQDYSYEYGRGVSRFEETKVKQPKKDLGPHIYLYADRCILCSRCVRFTREVTGTAELLIQGRGNRNEIDVFPGRALDNELSGNVADLCPVGALLDKDFLFVQRVWFLKETPSIDGITAGGDNIWVHHNEGRVYRVKPRENARVNKWWITDEVRYGWKFVHREDRLRSSLARRFGSLVSVESARAYEAAVDGMRTAVEGGKRLGLLVSPMLACEEAFVLAQAAVAIDPEAVLAVGPIPVHGRDRVFPPNLKVDDPKAFVMYAEKCPNARGVRRVLEAVAGSRKVLAFDQFLAYLRGGSVGAAIVTGNYPSDWAGDELIGVLGMNGRDRRVFTVVLDTLPGPLTEGADVVLPGATWLEKAGTFQNARGQLQVFEQAIPVIEGARPEGQIALDLLALCGSVDAQKPPSFDAARVRADMVAAYPALAPFAEVAVPPGRAEAEPDMQVVEV